MRDDIQKQLAEEEREEIQSKQSPPIHATTASMFIVMGLDLEHRQ